MIKLICIGKIKEKYLIDGINEYQKRLSKYTKLTIIELKDSSYDDIEKIKKEEANLILKHLKETDNIIILDILGHELTSQELTEKLISLELQNSNLTFIIGGSYGLDEEIKRKANYTLSFSKLEAFKLTTGTLG